MPVAWSSFMAFGLGQEDPPSVSDVYFPKVDGQLDMWKHVEDGTKVTCSTLFNILEISKMFLAFSVPCRKVLQMARKI